MYVFACEQGGVSALTTLSRAEYLETEVRAQPQSGHEGVKQGTILFEEGARRMTQGCCGLPLFTFSILQAFQHLPAGNDQGSLQRGEGLKVLALARTKYLLKGSSFLPH